MDAMRPITDLCREQQEIIDSSQTRIEDVKRDIERAHRRIERLEEEIEAATAEIEETADRLLSRLKGKLMSPPVSQVHIAIPRPPNSVRLLANTAPESTSPPRAKALRCPPGLPPVLIPRG